MSLNLKNTGAVVDYLEILNARFSDATSPN